MNLGDHIGEAYKTAKGYPDLVQKLVAIGVQSYTADVATGTILYRFANGENVLHSGSIEPRTIAQAFNEAQTIQAVKDTQQGKTGYPAFMEDIAHAGVRFYEATLQGNKRVTYIGFGGLYEEAIPG